MSAPFTTEQEAQVRAIVAEMIGQALRGADARVCEITNSAPGRRCDSCTVAAHRPGAACNHPDCDLRGRPAPKTGATPPSPRARVAPVPNHVRPPVHAQRDTETKERNHVC